MFKLPLRRAIAIWMGALFATASTGAAAITQTSGYDYDANGFLLKEITEQGDTAACVARVYTPDHFGRPQDARLRNCNGSAPTLAGAPTEAAAPAAGSDTQFPDRDSTLGFTNPANTADTERRFAFTVTNVLGHVETLAYDRRFALPVSVTQPNLTKTQIAYDSLGRKIQEIGADGNGVQVDYLFCSGTNGGTLACPAHGIWAEQLTPVSGAIITADANGVTSLTKGTKNGPVSVVYHDSQGRVIRQQTQGFDGTPVYVDLSIQRKATGNTVSVSMPYYQNATPVWKVTTKDILGRATEIDTPAAIGATATSRIAYAGLTVTMTNPDPNSDGGTVNTVVTRNRIGEVASVVDAAGHTMTHAYDAFGNRVQTIDVAGNVRSTVFDSHGYGRAATSYDPDLGIWGYTYDALGDLKSRTNAKSQKSTLVYDGLGRVTSRSEPDLNSTWTYDSCTNGKGGLCEVTADDGFDRTYTIDTAGRVTGLKLTMPGGTVYTGSQHYNADGRVDTVTYPATGVVVSNAYNATGYLKTVTDATPNVSAHPVYWTGEAFDAAGHPTQYTYGNNVRTIDSYFDDGHLKVATAGLVVNNVPGGEVSNSQYSYHLAGTLGTRIDTDAPGAVGITANYAYDSLGRLTGESRSGGGLPGTSTLAWTYDAIGNMTSRTDSTAQGGYVNVYNYNGSGAGSVLPHAVASVSGFVDGIAVPAYHYDAEGNMTSGAGRSMNWTSYDMVQSVTKGTTTLAYLYDTDHQRATETESVNGTLQRTTHYMNPPVGGGLFFERQFGVAGTVEKSYISANGQVVAVRTYKGGAWSTLYWHKDNLGSNVAVSDDTGHVVERLAYDPFGARRYANGVSDTTGMLAAQTTERGFTEHEHMDDVGLVNMNGRIFDPQLGRFLSADTLSSAYDTQGGNRYSYARNSPTALVDPSGHDTDPSYGIPLTDSQMDLAGTWNIVPAHWDTPGAFGMTTWPNAGTVSAPGATQIVIVQYSFFVYDTTSNSQAKPPGFDDQRWAIDNPAYTPHFQAPTAPAGPSVGNRVAHGALDAAAMVPGWGTIPALVSAGWSFYEGDYIGGGLSLLTAIPIAGDAAGAAKLARNAERAEHIAEEVADASKFCPCCFVAGTPVLTEFGPMPIEKVEVGTKVQSRDEKTGRVELKPVTALIHNNGRPLYALVMLQDSGKMTRIEVSDNHPFWVVGKGWIESSQLQRGMHLQGFDNKPVTVANLQALGRSAKTYNFTVADYHTFYAGENPVLVHNSDCPCAAAAEAVADAAVTKIEYGVRTTRNSATQIHVDLTQSEAIDNLVASGFEKSFSKDGTVTILTDGTKTYRFYPSSTGGGMIGAPSGMPSASVSIFDQIVTKLRFTGQ